MPSTKKLEDAVVSLTKAVAELQKAASELRRRISMGLDTTCETAIAEAARHLEEAKQHFGEPHRFTS